MKTKQDGFIALISLIILSVVLMVTVLSLAQFGIVSRFSLLDLERKSESTLLAEACLHIARIDIVNDPSHAVTSPTTESVGDDGECIIVSVTDNGNTSDIETSAQVDGATTNLQTEVNSDTSSSNFGKFIRLNEVADL